MVVCSLNRRRLAGFGELNTEMVAGRSCGRRVEFVSVFIWPSSESSSGAVFSSMEGVFVL